MPALFVLSIQINKAVNSKLAGFANLLSKYGLQGRNITTEITKGEGSYAKH